MAVKSKFRVRYSPDADAMVITVRSGKLDHSDEKAPEVIMHYNRKDELVEIEILDASELVSATVHEMAKTTRESLIRAEAAK